MARMVNPLLSLEPVVQAGAQDAVGKSARGVSAHAGAGRITSEIVSQTPLRRNCARYTDAAQIHVKIFGLPTPISRQSTLDSETECPANLRLRAADIERDILKAGQK